MKVTNRTPKDVVAERYRIVSSFDLPFRFKGTFTFAKAYAMTCDWNSWHDAKDMAWPEKVSDDHR